MSRLNQALDRLLQTMEARGTFLAQLGDGSGNVYTDETDLVWARVQLETGLTVTKIRCLKALIFNNAYVKVRWNATDRVLEVTEPDLTMAKHFFSGVPSPGGVASVAAHGSIHSGPKSPDPVWVHAQQILPGLTRPTNPASLSLQVEGFFEQFPSPHHHLRTDLIDLTSLIPTDTNEHRLLILCWATLLESLIVVGASPIVVPRLPWETTTTNPFDEDDVDAVVVDRSYQRLAAIWTYTGLTSLTWANIIFDLRPWAGPPAPGDVRVSSDDVGWDYLEGKIVPGSNITLAVRTDGNGVETLEISSSGGSLGTYDPDLPPVGPDGRNDEFNDGSFDTGKWTEFDPDSALAISETGTVCTLTMPEQADDTPSGIYQSGPVGDFTIVAKFKMTPGLTAPFNSNWMTGFMVWDDATDDDKPILIYGLGGYRASGIGYMGWGYFVYTGPYHDDPTISIAGSGSVDTYYYVRLVCDNYTFYFDRSTDGLVWTRTDITSVLSVMLGTVTPDQIGLGMVNKNCDSTIVMTLDFCRWFSTAHTIDDPVYGNVTPQDHGLLVGLGDDDHTQYHNNTRGDARYSQLEHTHTEADITDLEHDAVKIQGRDVDSTAPDTGQGLIWDGDSWAPTDITAGAESFTDLDDVPADYTSDGLKLVRVKSDETGLEFVDPTGITGVDASAIRGKSVTPTAPSNKQILEFHSSGDTYESTTRTVGDTTWSGNSTSTYAVQEIQLNFLVKGRVTALNFSTYTTGSSCYAEIWDSTNTILIATSQSIPSVALGTIRLPFSTEVVLPAASYRVKFYRSPNLRNMKGYSWTTTEVTTTTITTDIPPCSVEAYWRSGSQEVIEWVDGPSRLQFTYPNVSNPPTDAELDSAYGTPATVGAGFTRILDDAGGHSNLYLVVSDGANWWYTALTKAT